MERKRVLILAVAAIVVLFGAYFAFCRASDESKIRAQLDALARAVHVDAEDVGVNPIGRFAHVNDAFAKLFDKDVRVSIPELTTLHSGRRELAEAAASAPRYVRTLDVTFGSVAIKLAEGHESALVSATADIRATEHGDVRKDDKRAVDLRFARAGGDWLITSLTVWPKGEASPQ